MALTGRAIFSSRGRGDMRDHGPCQPKHLKETSNPLSAALRVGFLLGMIAL